MDALSPLVDSFELATQGWLPAAINAAASIFRRLAALELVIFGLVVAVKSRGEGAASFVPHLVWKLFLIGLLFTGLLLYPYWLPPILSSFAGLAGDITGLTTLNPVVIAQQGLALAIRVLASAIAAGWVFPGGGLLGAFIGGVAAFGVALSFIAIAAVLLKTLIESWIVVAAGPIFLGFAPFRFTAQLADNFLAYAFEVGLKFFFLLLMTAAAGGLAQVWAQQLTGLSIVSLELILEVLAGSILLAVALWTVPTRVADALTRGMSFGLAKGLAED